MGDNKFSVFVIMPFGEDFLALFDELKSRFSEKYLFTNAGDLDNQQNILKDIVEGISVADVVIADLTGLNANVFYELGLAHAMNKKVIIITQDINELPFDIKSYRATQYSLKFNKLPKLIDELHKLLDGAIDGSVKYGNPVSDYAPKLSGELIEEPVIENTTQVIVGEPAAVAVKKDERGFLDYLTEIQDNSQLMNDTIQLMGSEMADINSSVNSATEEINRVKFSSGNVDAAFVKNICRKLSEPIGNFAEKLRAHVININDYWAKVEDSYLELLDNRFTKNPQNLKGLEETAIALIGMQDAVTKSNNQVNTLINALQGCIGIERRLNRAISALVSEFQSYQTMTGTIFASVDRIISKNNILVEGIKHQLK